MSRRWSSQNRGRTTAISTGTDRAPEGRTIDPAGSFGEMRELHLAGLDGWHGVEVGTNHHRVLDSSTPWEHRRASGARAARQLTDQG